MKNWLFGYRFFHTNFRLKSIFRNSIKSIKTDLEISKNIAIHTRPHTTLQHTLFHLILSTYFLLLSMKNSHQKWKSCKNVLSLTDRKMLLHCPPWNRIFPLLPNLRLIFHTFSTNPEKKFFVRCETLKIPHPLGRYLFCFLF